MIFRLLASMGFGKNSAGTLADIGDSACSQADIIGTVVPFRTSSSNFSDFAHQFCSFQRFRYDYLKYLVTLDSEDRHNLNNLECTVSVDSIAALL